MSPVPEWLRDRLAGVKRLWLFLDYDGTLAEFAPTPEHILPDPALIKLLSECLPGKCEGALCVNALAHQLGVTQSAVSQHLRVLRQARLVRGERRGTFVHYSLDRDALEQHLATLRETLGEEFVMIR